MASGADHISNLPEDVLHHILSLLPAQDAVRTCVLAQSWHDLWRSAPAVRVAGYKDWPGGIDAFCRFVDGLLRHRRRGTPLDSCDFDLDLEVGRSDGAAMERQGNSCIRRALRRQVRELRFRVGITPRVPFTLSDRPLASEHLTRLELAGVQGNTRVLDFSGCPSLEELKMEDCFVGSLDIHSPYLKHVRIKYCIFYSNYRTRLFFPNLVSLEFSTNVGRAPLLESMPSLATDDDCENSACEGCYYYYGPNDNNCVFLRGLTEATSLYLSALPEMYVFNRDLKWHPTFSKLKTLVLRKWFVAADFRSLIWFLHNAPLLEKLTLIPPKVHNNFMKKEERYEPSGQAYASGHLKLVEIICKEVDAMVLKSMKILIANGIPLEKIKVHCSSRFNWATLKFSRQEARMASFDVFWTYPEH